MNLQNGNSGLLAVTIGAVARARNKGDSRGSTSGDGRNSGELHIGVLRDNRKKLSGWAEQLCSYFCVAYIAK